MMSGSKRQVLNFAIKLLKDNCSKSTDDLEALRMTNSSINILEDDVRIRENIHKVRRLYFKSNVLQTVGWVVNEDLHHCMECSKPFGVVTRKHHCRQCGNLVCKQCTRNSVATCCEELGVSIICTRCFYEVGRDASLDIVAIAKAEDGEKNYPSEVTVVVQEVENLPSMQDPSDSMDETFLLENDAEQEDNREDYDDDCDAGEDDGKDLLISELQEKCSQLHSDNELLRHAVDQQEEEISRLKEKSCKMKKLQLDKKRIESNFHAATTHISLLESQNNSLKGKIAQLEQELAQWKAKKRSSVKSCSHCELKGKVPAQSAVSQQSHFLSTQTIIQQCIAVISEENKENSGVQGQGKMTELKRLVRELQRVAEGTDAEGSGSSSADRTPPSCLSPQAHEDWTVGIDSNDYLSPSSVHF